MDNPGVLYFVVGKRGEKKYLDMLKTSAKSLKLHMPWLKTALFTDLDIKELEYFDDIIPTKHCEQGGLWIYKWEECLIKSPYNPTLHLDADTYICEPFSEVFTILDRFDLVIPLSPHYGSLNRDWYGKPAGFPELACGFMLWKKNEKIDWLFDRTLELLKMKLTKRADEPYFAVALYESDVRYAIIPWEYTCVFNHPGYLYSKVKIMHGKNNIVRNAEIFNEDPGKRIFTGEDLIRLDVRNRSSKIKEMIRYRR